ncbi:MAG: hypothetical protein Q9190_002958 [Brigantiaea leucoxantha]
MKATPCILAVVRVFKFEAIRFQDFHGFGFVCDDAKLSTNKPVLEDFFKDDILRSRFSIDALISPILIHTYNPIEQLVAPFAFTPDQHGQSKSILLFSLRVVCFALDGDICTPSFV